VRKSLLVVILCIVVIFSAVFFFMNQLTSEKNEVVMIIQDYYSNEDGLVKSYGRNENIVLLSESIGLYMEYLLLIQNEAEFQKQYQLLKENFLVQKGDYVFVKWKVANDITTNALVDDLRIIRVLNEASKNFNEPRYKNTATKILKAITKKQMAGKNIADFYDWELKSPADTIHFSYLDVMALKDTGILERTITPLVYLDEEKGAFFSEIYNIQTGSVELFSSEKVNLIDQLLISLQLERINRTPVKFTGWLLREWKENGRIYGQYYRKSPHEEAVNYESSSVYSLATVYLLEIGKKQYAVEMHKKLIKSNLLKEDTDYRNVHFFDLIHYAIADYVITNNK
jgi:hypothetical protein